MQITSKKIKQAVLSRHSMQNDSLLFPGDKSCWVVEGRGEA